MTEGIFVLYAGKLFNETSKQMFVKIWDIVHEKHDDLKELIKFIDLDSRVELIESVVRDITDDMKIHKISPNHSLELALCQIKNIITDIHSDLNDIKKGIEYHKTLWFNYIRIPEYYKIIEKVKEDKKILDSRFDNLVKVISLFKQNEIYINHSTSTSTSTTTSTPAE
jgi:hypothetical protein